MSILTRASFKFRYGPTMHLQRRAVCEPMPEWTLPHDRTFAQYLNRAISLNAKEIKMAVKQILSAKGLEVPTVMPEV